MSEPVTEEDENSDSGEVTYFVDEEGRYYYQPSQASVGLPAADEETLDQVMPLTYLLPSSFIFNKEFVSHFCNRL